MKKYLKLMDVWVLRLFWKKNFFPCGGGKYLSKPKKGSAVFAHSPVFWADSAKRKVLYFFLPVSAFLFSLLAASMFKNSYGSINGGGWRLTWNSIGLTKISFVWRSLRARLHLAAERIKKYLWLIDHSLFSFAIFNLKNGKYFSCDWSLTR